jgi:Tol biopolymer transport system component
MDADGSNPSQLTADAAYRDERPVWSSDGESILFTRIGNSPEAGGPSLWMISSRGGAPARLTDVSAAPSDLRPDVPFWFGYYGYVAWDRYFSAWWPASGS